MSYVGQIGKSRLDFYAGLDRPLLGLRLMFLLSLYLKTDEFESNGEYEEDKDGKYESSV